MICNQLPYTVEAGIRRDYLFGNRSHILDLHLQTLFQSDLEGPDKGISKLEVAQACCPVIN